MLKGVPIIIEIKFNVCGSDVKAIINSGVTDNELSAVE
jgi:hypothetical protein